MAKSVDEYLNEVDYSFKDYIPSEGVLKFINFIQMASGDTLENKTPLVHLKMCEAVFNSTRNTAVLCHRGIGKTSVFAEWLFLYAAAFGELPCIGKVEFAVYIGDSIENGVKSLRKNIEYRYQNSEFLQKLIPNKSIKYVDEDGNEDDNVAAGRKITDVRLEFVNLRGDRFVVKLYGAKALSLDSKLYTDTGEITIESCKIGDKIFAADGSLCKIIAKSEVFHKPMYKITLADGRSIKVSEDHLNSVIIRSKKNNLWVEEPYTLTTKELLTYPISEQLIGIDKNKNKYFYTKSLMFIENCKPIQYSYKKDLLIDPYTLGLLLGDGTLRLRNNCIRCEFTSDEADLEIYKQHIPYTLGTLRKDPRRNNVITTTVKGLAPALREYKLYGTSYEKFIPKEYFYGDINQRLSLLQGLLDTDGTINKDRGTVKFSTVSKQLSLDVVRLVRSLGGIATIAEYTNAAKNTSYNVHIHLNLRLFRLPRKYERQRFDRKTKVAIIGIEKIEQEPSQCIAIDNVEHQFITTDFIRTHNTGLRGAKEYGKRPTLAIVDDIISDEDARSDTVIKTIEDTIHKAVKYALSPVKHKVIWLGTPFNAKDPLYKIVESGAWEVVCYPVCEKFPCTKEEFKGSWEDRFSYEYVKDAYEEAMSIGKIDSFYQELMLRITSKEDVLIPNSSLVFFNREQVLKHKDRYNFYITTDLATSAKKNADFSVISVWAYSNNGDYMLVDGWCDKTEVSKFINKIFEFIPVYNPIGVGIEVTGQQAGFISWLRDEMLAKNIYFNFLSSNNNGEDGIRPTGDKFSRFILFKPRFDTKKVWIANEMKDTEWYNEFEEERSKATKQGFKSKHDDVLDSISMLGSFDAFKPNTYGTYDNEVSEITTIRNTVF